MLGGYYHSLAAKAMRAQNNKRGEALFPLSEAQPQFGGTLSSQERGYIVGICEFDTVQFPWDSNLQLGNIDIDLICFHWNADDTKIQHIANSTTMQTVSSSLAIALSDFEASQSRSTRLGVFERPKSESSGVGKEQHEMLSPRHQTFTTSRLRDVVSYQISGQCFRPEDDSTIASQEECVDENASTSSHNAALTRLQFVVTSIFGLREAARFKSVPFEHYCSRLFMVSCGPNVTGDGLDGCSRQTLEFLCAYNPGASNSSDSDHGCCLAPSHSIILWRGFRCGLHPGYGHGIHLSEDCWKGE